MTMTKMRNAPKNKGEIRKAKAKGHASRREKQEREREREWGERQRGEKKERGAGAACKRLLARASHQSIVDTSAAHLTGSGNDVLMVGHVPHIRML